eukprot:g69001.t1
MKKQKKSIIDLERAIATRTTMSDEPELGRIKYLWKRVKKEKGQASFISNGKNFQILLDIDFGAPGSLAQVPCDRASALCKVTLLSD